MPRSVPPRKTFAPTIYQARIQSRYCSGMRARERSQAPGDAGLAQLIPEIRARRQTQQPDAADSLGAETFAQDGVARASLFRWRDLGAMERLVDLAQDGRFHGGAKSGSDYGGIDASPC